MKAISLKLLIPVTLQLLALTAEQAETGDLIPHNSASRRSTLVASNRQNVAVRGDNLNFVHQAMTSRATTG